MLGMRLFIPIVALGPLLASCASSGLYNMSDDWCAAHVNASTSRCPLDRPRVADNQRQRAADNGPRGSD